MPDKQNAIMGLALHVQYFKSSTPSLVKEELTESEIRRILLNNV